MHMVGENEAIIKNCGNYVQHFLPSDTAEVFEAVVVYLYPDSLREIYKDKIPSFLSDETVHLPKKLIANKLIEQFMGNLFLYFEDPDAFDDELGVLKLKELVMILLK
jgi:hypothetical protein